MHFAQCGCSCRVFVWGGATSSACAWISQLRGSCNEFVMAWIACIFSRVRCSISCSFGRVPLWNEGRGGILWHLRLLSGFYCELRSKRVYRWCSNMSFSGSLTFGWLLIGCGFRGRGSTLWVFWSSFVQSKIVRFVRSSLFPCQFLHRECSELVGSARF